MHPTRGRPIPIRCCSRKLSEPEIKEGEVALSMRELKPHPNCPNVLRLQRALLPGEPSLVPGKMPLCQRLVLVMHDRLLGSDHAHPASGRPAEHSIAMASLHRIVDHRLYEPDAGP